MLTLFFTLILLPLFVYFGHAIYRWSFKSSSEIYDPEWELYQQRYD